MTYQRPIHWSENAACLGQTDLFFPTAIHGPSTFDRARMICRSCPVLAECRADIQTNPSPYGFYAGTTPEERGQALFPRNRYRRNRRRQAA